MMTMGDPFVTYVRPAPVEHDPQALADAEAAAKADAAAWEEAAAALDAIEGRARRHASTVPPGDLRAAQLAEEGARRRLDRSRRAVEERRVAALIAAAVDELPELDDAVTAADQAAGAALDDLAAATGELHRYRARLVAALRAAAPDELAARLRLTGLEDRWAALPPAGPDPAARIAAAAQAATNRAARR
jgi:hypothetical protein